MKRHRPVKTQAQNAFKQQKGQRERMILSSSNLTTWCQRIYGQSDALSRLVYIFPSGLHAADIRTQRQRRRTLEMLTLLCCCILLCCRRARTKCLRTLSTFNCTWGLYLQHVERISNTTNSVRKMQHIIFTAPVPIDYTIRANGLALKADSDCLTVARVNGGELSGNVMPFVPHISMLVCLNRCISLQLKSI